MWSSSSLRTLQRRDHQLHRRLICGRRRQHQHRDHHLRGRCGDLRHQSLLLLQHPLGFRIRGQHDAVCRCRDRNHHDNRRHHRRHPQEVIPNSPGSERAILETVNSFIDGELRIEPGLLTVWVRSVLVDPSDQSFLRSISLRSSSRVLPSTPLTSSME